MKLTHGGQAALFDFGGKFHVAAPLYVFLIICSTAQKRLRYEPFLL